MNYFSADFIFPVSSPPIKNGVVAVDDDGTVVEISNTNSAPYNKHLNGVIVPGFVNAHCHLELSYLKNQVSEGKGMAGFISELVPKRNKFTEEQIKIAIADAEAEMITNGIVAVGDISNTNHSFEQKKGRDLYYHTFIEIFDLNPEKAQQVFNEGKKLLSSISHLPSSIVPHAPYSVTPDLFELISELNQEITCIHNQESKAENELFNKKSGALLELFFKLGYDLDWIEETGKNSIRSVLPHLLKNKKIQLVHNTFTSKKDFAWAQSFITNPIPGNEEMQLYWCTCPNANMYIENKLPDYNILMNGKVTIGTDSYASNWSLSILDEMKTIQKHFSGISLEKLLEWGTKNGAEFLGLEKTLGTIEKNKKPGLNLIENFDLNSFSLTEKSSVRKLI